MIPPDPDPQRKHVACPDCRTPALALTGAPGLGPVLAIQHDDGCPYYRGLSDDERTHVGDDVVIVHVSITDTREDQP